MAMQKENTVLTPATSPTDSEPAAPMTDEQFEREKRYQASMNLFQNMLNKGLITPEQYAIIDTIMTKNAELSLDTIFSEIP